MLIWLRVPCRYLNYIFSINPLTPPTFPLFLHFLACSARGVALQCLSLCLQKNWALIMENGITEETGDPRCKYTVMAIENEDHRDKLEKFIKLRGKITDKSSLCRFYLRGICIMKPEYCKFAHSVAELQLNEEEAAFYLKLSDKERRKRQFVEKREFNQTALFILKNVKYHVLHTYQQGERYRKSGLPVHSLEAISEDRSARIRIREIMHRENWDGFIDFLETKFPGTNYPISFISYWYANFGFDKPQTRCKFGDFLKYAMYVRKYIQIDIVFPPNLQPCIYMVNSQSKATHLERNVEFLYEHCMKEKEQEGKDKMEEFLEKALPQELSKKYMCRYFMAGNCQQSAQECLYAHSVEQLQEHYELGQEFPVEYRQPVMPIEVRMNFTSLFEATRVYEQYQGYSLEDINLNSTIRCELRQKVHHQLFRDFMKLVESLMGTQVKEAKQEGQLTIFSVPLKDLQKYYQGAGFNHTNENKFQHLEQSLWSLGFYMEDVVMKDEQTLQKKKSTYVYKIPPIEYLDSKYRDIIGECVSEQLGHLGEKAVLLESALKRTIYGVHRQHVLPLHVYLRYRNTSFQEAVREFCPEPQLQRIFFESGQQNMQKLGQIVRKYAKKNRKYIVKLDQIEGFIKSEKKEEINTNHLVNMRASIQNTLLGMGKRIYFWPFDNNTYVVDPNLLPAHKKTASSHPLENQQSLQQFKMRSAQQGVLAEDFVNERIVVVDSLMAFAYAGQYLEKCNRMGVDLEGRLRADGYIDLVQIVGVKMSKDKIQHKQIFVFDMWKMAREESSKGGLYGRVASFLKGLFESSRRVKVMHDCRQDSIALKHILGITLANVFDTSGFDVYMGQHPLYEGEEQAGSAELLRRIYDVKVPGLNTILDAYKAPNGVNVFKDSMKKRFGEPGSRKYFEQRPLAEEFLEYSARDVEDLVEVWQNMNQLDKECLGGFIGSLYSTC